MFENYKKQFQKDFTTFLESRSIEIVRGGRMVLTCVGRSEVDPCGNEGGQISNLIARSLVDLVKEVYILFFQFFREIMVTHFFIWSLIFMH